MHDGAFWKEYLPEFTIFPLYFGLVEPADKRNAVIQWVLERGVGNIECFRICRKCSFGTV